MPNVNDLVDDIRQGYTDDIRVEPLAKDVRTKIADGIDEIARVLQEEINQEFKEVDKTLTQPDQGADAQVTGMRLTALKYITDSYDFRKSEEVSVTPSEGYIEKETGTVHSSSTYNFVSFLAVSSLVYKIVYLSGASYDLIRGIELIKDGNVITYEAPEDNSTYTRYIVNFDGVVRISYRNSTTIKISSGTDNSVTIGEVSVPDWTTNTWYEIGSLVYYNSACKRCTVSHTSADSAASENWEGCWSNTNELYSSDPYFYKTNSSIIEIDKFVVSAARSDVGDIYYNVLNHSLILNSASGASGNKTILPRTGTLYKYKNRVYKWVGYELQPIDVDVENRYVPSVAMIGYRYTLAGNLMTETNCRISVPIQMNTGDTIRTYQYAMTNQAVIFETDVDGNFKQNLVTPVVGSVSEYEYTAMRNMYICVSGYLSDMIAIELYHAPRDIIIEPEINLSVNLQISLSGGVFNGDGTSAGHVHWMLSDPIPVRAGDHIKLYSYARGQAAAIAWSYNKFSNLSAEEHSYRVISPCSNSGIYTFEALIDRDGYIIVSSIDPNDVSGGNYAPKLTITRSFDSAMADYAASKIKPNYTDIYDFAPNLAKKRTNSILTYEGDTKSSSNYMVNAVVYPNGEIIACRSGGKVVKIALDGTETQLLDENGDPFEITHAQDWRGMFMDSNLNVYVSPHSSTFTAIDVADRGLYKLPYGSNQLTKVISLYVADYGIIPVWRSEETYNENDWVFYRAIFYKCKDDNTHGSTFNESEWDAAPEWSSGTSYAVGDIVLRNYKYYLCTNSHTAALPFDRTKWMPATQAMDNDDTIWTMCEDKDGYLYAGVYAHSKRKNPAIYRSTNGTTWEYIHNFINSGVLSLEDNGNQPVHVHCVNYNEFDGCLYAAVGEVNTIVKSSDHGINWTDLKVMCYYGQPTYVLGVKDGLVIGSDGHYSCGVSKLKTDDMTIRGCGRTVPGYIFNIRRSDLTGWLYAFTRIDLYLQGGTKYPPIEAVSDPAALETWKATADPDYVKVWTLYNEWASKYYPEDAVRPTHAVMMVSKDDGDTWEVFRHENVSYNYATLCGYITVGYFRDGECLVGRVVSKGSESGSGKAFTNPIIISEGKKRRTPDGYDLEGEIFIITNEVDTVDF